MWQVARTICVRGVVVGQYWDGWSDTNDLARRTLVEDKTSLTTFPSLFLNSFLSSLTSPYTSPLFFPFTAPFSFLPFANVIRCPSSSDLTSFTTSPLDEWAVW